MQRGGSLRSFHDRIAASGGLPIALAEEAVRSSVRNFNPKRQVIMADNRIGKDGLRAVRESLGRGEGRAEVRQQQLARARAVAPAARPRRTSCACARPPAADPSSLPKVPSHTSKSTSLASAASASSGRVSVTSPIDKPAPRRSEHLVRCDDPTVPR